MVREKVYVHTTVNGFPVYGERDVSRAMTLGVQERGRRQPPIPP